ncbi:KpsF/GutQ family sugar-phosphate isomerase [Candidatus Aminicenantes bacterium AH-873-B07]|jgi:arabinose-5-phosphate isomerase|nr:KpsF/GutQ family sugar-phosphate isomerase [Candidatus Aminicenantes bacterium AH-873-B07]
MINVGKKVLEVEAEAVKNLIDRIDKQFEKAVELLYECKGKVVITGIGKSGLIAQKIAATFTSTGTPAIFIHPTEAVHGDLGIILDDDIIIAISYSGETKEIITLLEFIKRIGVKLIALTGNKSSKLAKYSDIVLDISVEQEACPIGLIPTSSTTAALAMGDALAIAVMQKKGFGKEDFAFVHPRGQIGKKLLKVKHLMHTGEEIPIVCTNTSMRETVEEMTRKKLGVTCVIDKNKKLVGIITDGDLRRLLIKYGSFMNKTAGECMKHDPITIDKEELATEALNIMEERKITSLIIKNKKGEVEGIIHLHDLWRTEMF